MNYNGSIDLALGMSAESKKWVNKKLTWSEIVGRLGETAKTNETLQQFLAATKEEQGKIKDVGGYVGGLLRGGRRKQDAVVHRQLLTLDIDFAHIDFWEDFCLQFNNAAVLHGTHKHSCVSPRFRLVMPLNREVTPDEYVPISRKVASYLNIELFDNTTFEVHRLMFWPSTPKNEEYYFKFQDGPWLDADQILASYQDWQDSAQWPVSDAVKEKIRTGVSKQADPDTKGGIIGAFCRSYTIEGIIDKYLSDIYEPAGDGRYTYVKGSTAGGLVIYDNKFAFSHHGTDPCSNKLCNAFDLVRLHKFGHLDEDNATSLKSFKAMEDLAAKDEETKKLLAIENLERAKYDFSEELVESNDLESLDWMKDLEIDSKGQYKSTAPNINLIFANDIRLKGTFKQNEFDGKKYVFKNLPWRKVAKPEPIKNVDFSGVRNYIESIYGISGNLKIDDALIIEFEKNLFHPVRDYLKALKWDGVKRVDTLLIDYFGADNNIYSREAIRKTLVGAVARIFRPGVKFDLMLTLVGAQGTGKSTFLHHLGGEWFSDTFMGVHGKEALEQIQGAWIIEVAELAGIKKAEIESIKHFISKQKDDFRPAYARSSESFPRQCIFVGTTNNKDFLRDPSGNRRFMPVDVSPNNAFLNIFDLNKDEVNQIWAEAVELYKNGEVLYLSPEAEDIARLEQKKHSETDERQGVVEDFLETILPYNWEDLDIFARRLYLADKTTYRAEGFKRDSICVAAVWCECLGKEREDIDRYKTREINDILRGLDGWELSKSVKIFRPYGRQKFYTKIK